MTILSTLGSGLWMAFLMFWQMLWALILGFGISAIVQAVLDKGQVAKALPDASIGSLLKACGLGAASSSCSYAATAIARSLFRKGANFTSSIAFEFASTNLVIELGILLWVLLGWQFTAAEFLGGFVMIGILAVLFKLFLKKRDVDEARAQANKGVPGVMEGHAAMDMSVHQKGSWLKKATSPAGFTSISHFFIMDAYSLWRDIALGVVLSGLLAAIVPMTAWQSLFYSGHGAASTVWGALIGPLVSFLSFVCSVGNVPMAAVLWSGGISFAGVISFIFADLLIIPILNIYRKYYGVRMMIFLGITSYAAMVLAGIAIEGLFSALGLIPQMHVHSMEEMSISWNYTTILNILFLIPAVIMLVRFFKTDGIPMLKMMDMTEEEMAGHDHSCHSGHDAHAHHDHGGHDHAHHDHSQHTHVEMPVMQAASCCHPAEPAKPKEHAEHDHSHHGHEHHH
jgi:uncharacterized protein